MPATRTLAQMRVQALRYADLDGFPSVVEAADPFINARILELYDILILCRGDDYYSTDTSISTVADQAVYTWAEFSATDFYRLVSLRASRDTIHHALDSFSADQLPALLMAEAAGSGWNVLDLMKRLRPTGVEIRPAPSDANITLTLTYIPAATLLSSDGDTFDGINGWERWVELGAAIDLREKEELDATGLIQRQMQIEERIRSLAGTRDNSRPARRQILSPRRRWLWW